LHGCGGKSQPSNEGSNPTFQKHFGAARLCIIAKKHKKQNEAYASVLDSFLSEAADNSVLGKQKENC